MNLYFLSLLEDKKIKGHKQPLSKFQRSIGKSSVTFQIGSNEQIMIGVEGLFDEIIWFMELPKKGRQDLLSIKIGDKTLINSYLLEFEFKKKNLFLRLTDHIVQYFSD